MKEVVGDFHFCILIGEKVISNSVCDMQLVSSCTKEKRSWWTENYSSLITSWFLVEIGLRSIIFYIATVCSIREVRQHH